LLDSKSIPTKTGNEKNQIDNNDDDDTPRSSTEVEEEIQTEPEDLSANKKFMSSTGIPTSIRVKSKHELNLLLDSSSSANKDDRMSPVSPNTHGSSGSIGPSEDDEKGPVVSTTGDGKEILFSENRNDMEDDEDDDEDEDDDNSPRSGKGSEYDEDDDEDEDDTEEDEYSEEGSSWL
jgi:hypothetical protein